MAACTDAAPPAADSSPPVAETVGRAGERILVDPPTERVALLGEPPHALAYPVAVAVSVNEDYVYVADMGEFVVRQFTIQGDFVRDYGGGQGMGPGEFFSLTDAEVDARGRVWTLDPSQGRIQLFDADGTVVETIRTPGSATAFERIPGGGVVLMVLDSLLFRALTPAGEVIHNFGRVADDQRARAIALWGFVDSDGENIFYSGTYGGYVGRWSTDDGTLAYLRPSIVEQGYPEVVTQSGATMVDPESRRWASFGLHVGRDTLYVLGAADGRRLVDLYEAGSGEYLYSIPLPEREVSALSVTTDHLLLVHDTLVSIWRR